MPDDVYEMLWDCKYCGQKKLLGLTHRFCATCGAPQDPNARYFPPDDEKVAVKDHPYVGADVQCPACRQPMSRAARCCTSCGSPIEKGAEVALRQDVVVPPPLSAPVAPPPKKSSGAVLGIVLALVGVVVIGILVAVLWRRDGVFVVTSQTWERSIAVERFEPTKKTSWCDEMPAGAHEIARRHEQRSTQKVQDGQTCATRKKDLGNGTFKEVKECTPKFKETPVMSDRCDYELSEWHTARTATANGTSPDAPRWPDTSLGAREREGARTEKYTVLFADSKSGAQASCELPQSKWSGFPKSSRWKGKVRVATGGVDCDALVRN